jgi:hypothetical protein
LCRGTIGRAFDTRTGRHNQRRWGCRPGTRGVRCGNRKLPTPTVDDALGIRLRREFQPVDDDARGAEPAGVASGVSHVVAVRQKDVAHPAPLLEASGQALHITRRIDEPVTRRMLHEIAVPAKGFPGIETAIGNAGSEAQREFRGGAHSTALVGGADGARRTSHQRAESGAEFVVPARLRLHERTFACVAESGGSQLPAGIAVDTGGVNEKRPLRIFGQALRPVGHATSIAC